MRRVLISIVCAAAAGGALLAATAQADFPYAAPGTDTKDYSALHTNQGQTPNDMDGNDEWKFAATPEDNNFPVNNDARENNGIRGGYLADSHNVPTGWTVSTGRPDVVIAELDSGVDWRDAGFIEDIRFKIRINPGELPTPNHAGPALVAGTNCATYQAKDDANNDGVFNLRDFACDDRLSMDEPNSVGPANALDPQDLLIAFTNDSDGDGNGYRDDIAGWDFLDNDNDAYDDVHYGHGTGEITGSVAEAHNGHNVGTCPNCMGIPLRVGNSFVADDTRFGLATIYAVDMGVSIVQEALGTLNNARIGQDAIDYAYKHGVVVIASAADEAAQHHNYPSSHAKPIVVNSVRNYDGDVPEVPRTYLSFNGCTNFSSKITLAIPSTSCSSNATEVAAGMAGIVYSAAMNAAEANTLDPHPSCKRIDGTPCPITANEVRQLMASGAFNGETQAQDVNFNKNPVTGTPQPEPSCNPAPAPGCTDPNLALQAQVNANRPIVSPPDSRSYPARFGFDQFYGYGRVNTYNAAHQVDIGHVPPEVEITGPRWYSQVDPTKATAGIDAQVWARGAAYSCRVYVAPGSYPNNNTAPAGDFEQVDSPVCNGQSRTQPIDGQVAALNLGDLKSHFPPDATTSGFRGRESGDGAGQTSNGRPNSEPYGFTVRVVATTTAENPGVTATGEDRRNLYLHRDQDMLPGFPRTLPSDGESSPAFADLDGDNRNEMIFGTSDGFMHAMRRDGSELPGWPVRTDRLPLHAGEHAFESGEVSADSSHGAVLSSPAVADLDRDGSPEVLVGDMEGKLYAWNADGSVRWKREANPDYSGKPLVPFVNERLTRRDRTSHRYIASPVAADLDRSDGGQLEVVAAAMDRHLYAYKANGSRVDGFPTVVVDPSKIGSIDPQSHQVRWNPATAPEEGNNGGDDPNQGAIIDTPAVGSISGDAHPEILLGTNEEYHTGVGNEGALNVGGFNAASFQALAPALAALGGSANARMFAIKSTGDADGNPKTGDWLAPGQWPAKIGILLAELLPEVGEGVTGYPVIGRMSCAGGESGRKIGVMPNNGFAYILNADGESCLGRQSGKDTPLDSDRSGGGIDHPQLAAVGHPAFANFAGGMSMVGPVAGLVRALDLVASEYQTGGEDYITAWDPTTGNMRPNFPQRMNDLQFITGPSVADVDGDAGGEMLEASAYLDLQAYNGDGTPVAKFPKLNSDWTVANPLIGTWGTRDTDASARRVVVNITRNGTIFAYSTAAKPCEANADHPLGDWPKFHHDLANSGDYERDGTNPGAPDEVSFSKGTLSFRAPGDDLLCGTAHHYELVESNQRLGGGRFDEGIPLPTPKPKAPGQQEKLTFSGKLQRFLMFRAVDEEGNVGPAHVLDLGPGGPGPGPGPGGGPGGGKGSPSRCVDRIAPRSFIHVSSLKQRKSGMTVHGHSLDAGCLNATAGKRYNNLIAAISVIRDAKGGKCRYLQRDGRFSKPRSCRRPLRLPGTGRYSLARHRLDWTVHTRRLGRGKYKIVARAADQSGNVEQKGTRKNRKVLRVKQAASGR